MSSMPAFLQLVNKPLKFRLFMLMKLPSAFFSGVRVVSADEAACRISVPFKWFSQNPFKSTYFACLAMAAEMSTGLLAMAQVHGRKPGVSMLVTGLEASYGKKATGLTVFTCDQGLAIKEAVEKAVATGDPQTIKVKSVGHSKSGEEIAVFYITWSFKRKQL